MSKCLRCGAPLPPVGECQSCAKQKAPDAVPELLQKDLQLDRRTRPQAATPPGLTPSRGTPAPASTPAWATPAAAPSAKAPTPPPGPAWAQTAAPGPRPLSPPLPTAAAARPPQVAPVSAPRPHATPDQFPETPVWSPFGSQEPNRDPTPNVSASPSSAPAPALAAAPAPVAPRPSIAPPKVIARSTVLSAAAAANPLELQARPAPWWRRVLSFTVDALAVLAVLALYLLAATAIAGRPAVSTHLTGIDAWFARIHAIEHLVIPGLALAAVLSIAYSAAFGFLWDGRTLGRRLMGIRLVDKTGLAPVPARAIIRSVLAIFSAAIFLGGFWLAFFDRKRQTLHDKLTSTYLVQPMN